jgi:hypothetical protein
MVEHARTEAIEQIAEPTYLAPPGNVYLGPTQLDNGTHMSQSYAGLGLSLARFKQHPYADQRYSEAPISDSESDSEPDDPLNSNEERTPLHRKLSPSPILRG